MCGAAVIYSGSDEDGAFVDRGTQQGGARKAGRSVPYALMLLSLLLTGGNALTRRKTNKLLLRW